MIALVEKYYRSWIAVLLLIFTLQCILSMREKTATYDEVGHIAAGYSFLKLNDYRLYDVDPPLIRQLCALPLLSMDLNFPLGTPAWKEKKAIQFGHEFLFKSNDAKADKILFWARIPAVILGVLLGIVIVLFTSQLFGKPAGIFTLFLYTFEPNVLANSRLVVTDLGLTLFMTLCIYFLYCYLKKPGWLYLIATGIVFGLAISSKASGVILGTVTFTFLVLINPFRSVASLKQFPRLALSYFSGIEFWKNLGRWGIVLFLGGVVLAMDYGFFKLWPIFIEEDDSKKFELTLEKLHLENPAVKQKIASFAAEMKFPARPFLVSFVKWFGFLPRLKEEGKVHVYSPYFIGKRGKFFAFPFLTFFLKEPLTVILLFFAGTFFLFFQGEWNKLLFLMLPILFIVAMTLKMHAWAYRYINLPTLPFVLIIAGSVIAYLSNNATRWKGYWIGMGLLSIWLMITTLSVFPHYLSYFNEVVGGARNGYHYLVNSNFDWGQDLKLLKQYVKKNNISEIQLSYFGSADPDYYGIPYRRMLGVNDWDYDQLTPEERQALASPRKGWIAISATCLQNIEGFYSGVSYDWLKSYSPVGRVGYSIFVFHIGELDGEGVQNGF